MLTEFDADVAAASRQLARFTGSTAFGGTTGEMCFVKGATTTELQIDTDGSGTASVTIVPERAHVHSNSLVLPNAFARAIAASGGRVNI